MGLPQRRRRVFIFASLYCNVRDMLLAQVPPAGRDINLRNNKLLLIRSSISLFHGVTHKHAVTGYTISFPLTDVNMTDLHRSKLASK